MSARNITSMTEHENNIAWLHNAKAVLFYQLEKFSKLRRNGYLEAKVHPVYSLRPDAERAGRTERIAEQLAGDDNHVLGDEAERFWLSALCNLYLTIDKAMADPGLTTGIRKRLVKMTNKRLNAMHDWLDGGLGAGLERVFF